jgi:hypothetical protein
VPRIALGAREVRDDRSATSRTNDALRSRNVSLTEKYDEPGDLWARAQKMRYANLNPEETRNRYGFAMCNDTRP